MIVINDEEIFTVDYWFIDNNHFISSEKSFSFLGFQNYSVDNTKAIPIHDIEELKNQLKQHPEYLDLRI